MVYTTSFSCLVVDWIFKFCFLFKCISYFDILKLVAINMVCGRFGGVGVIPIRCVGDFED